MKRGNRLCAFRGEYNETDVEYLLADSFYREELAFESDHMERHEIPNSCSFTSAMSSETCEQFRAGAEGFPRRRRNIESKRQAWEAGANYLNQITEARIARKKVIFQPVQ